MSVMQYCLNSYHLFKKFMICRCMSPWALDMLKIFKGALEPTRKEQLINQEQVLVFWSKCKLNSLSFDKGQKHRSGQFLKLQSSSETGTNLQYLFYLEHKILQFGLLSIRSTQSFFSYFIFDQNIFEKCFSHQPQRKKKDIILKFCVNFALRSA